MSPRKKSKPLSSVDLDKLRDLYVARNLSLSETAAALDISLSSVWILLKKIGVPKSQHPHAKYDVEEARKLYFDERWTLQQIADKFEVSRQAVHDRLTRAGYDLKSRKKVPTPLLDPGPLREMYVDRTMSIASIAREFDVAPSFVYRSLGEHGISRPSRRPKQFDRELIEDLYIRQGLLVREIAVKLGVNRYNVDVELHRHNITFRHNPGRRIVKPGRETLDRYYTAERLTLAEVGRLVGLSPGTIKKLLHEYGIERRPLVPGLKDLGVDRDRLYQLYVTDKMSVPQIAQKFGVTTSRVSKSLRLHGIKIRSRKITLEFDLLKKLIVDDKLTLRQAAIKIGVSYDIVRLESHRLGVIKSRKKKLPPIDNDSL